MLKWDVTPINLNLNSIWVQELHTKSQVNTFTNITMGLQICFYGGSTITNFVWDMSYFWREDVSKEKNKLSKIDVKYQTCKLSLWIYKKIKNRVYHGCWNNCWTTNRIKNSSTNMHQYLCCITCRHQYSESAFKMWFNLSVKTFLIFLLKHKQPRGVMKNINLTDHLILKITFSCSPMGKCDAVKVQPVLPGHKV